MIAQFPFNALGLAPNPFQVDVNAASDQIVPMAVGNAVLGEQGGKFVLVSFVGDGNKYYQGTAFSYDLDFVASPLLATPGATDATQTNLLVGTLYLGVYAKERQQNVIVSQNNQGFTFTSGVTYNVWLQTEGQSLMAFAAKPVGPVFTSATVGEFGAATATKAYTVQGVRANKGTITFTATGANGSFDLAVAAGGSNLDDILVPGAVLSATGVASNARIVAVWGSASLGYTIQLDTANTGAVNGTVTPSVIYVGLLSDALITTQAA